MITPTVPDYGRCPCGGVFEGRTVQIRMTVREETVHLADTPQGACPECGSRVYKAEILSRLEAVMKDETVDPRLGEKGP